MDSSFITHLSLTLCKIKDVKRQTHSYSFPNKTHYLPNVIRSYFVNLCFTVLPPVQDYALSLSKMRSCQAVTMKLLSFTINVVTKTVLLCSNASAYQSITKTKISRVHKQDNRFFILQPSGALNQGVSHSSKLD